MLCKTWLYKGLFGFWKKSNTFVKDINNNRNIYLKGVLIPNYGNF